MPFAASAASARRVSATLIAVGLWSVWSVLATAQGAAQPLETPEEAAPTPIEQALMEHVCSVVPAGGGPEAERYLVCMKAQLLSLRTDFGRDLSRLSPPERKAADAACNEVRTTSGRDAYLDCLGNQLTILPDQAESRQCVGRAGYAGHHRRVRARRRWTRPIRARRVRVRRFC